MAFHVLFISQLFILCNDFYFLYILLALIASLAAIDYTDYYESFCTSPPAGNSEECL